MPATDRAQCATLCKVTFKAYRSDIASVVPVNQSGESENENDG